MTSLPTPSKRSIFDERGPATPAAAMGIGVRMLLILVLPGIAMFFATRFLIDKYSG